MIATSAEYQASITKRTNRATTAKVEINFTDPFVDQSITVAVSGEGSASYKDQVCDGIYEPSHNWFPLDGTGLLDGTFLLMPPTSDTIAALSMEVGWWGDGVAGAGGTFPVAQVLTVEFTARAIESLLVCSDSIKSEYPVDFTIQLYDTDDVLLHTETVTGNTLVYWTATISSVAAVTKQVLTITKWSHVGRCCKIYEFFTSILRVYNGDEIFTMELLEERESDTASLPVGNISSNELTLKLYNLERQFDYGSPSAIANLVKPMRKISAYIGAAGVAGVTEWIPLGVFWSQEWQVPDDDQYVETVAYDLLTLMAGTDYSPGFMVNQTIYDIIVDICQSYGLLAGMYTIDPALDVNPIPYADLAITNHREALRKACEASLSTAHVDRLGVLHIEGPDYLKQNKETSLRTLTTAEYFTRKNPSRYAMIANVVRVNTSPLVPDAATTQVYQDTDTVVPAGATITIRANYTESPCINPVASLNSPPVGSSITSATYYNWGADVTIQNTAVTDATVELDIDANVLRIAGSRCAEARDESSIIEFGEKVFEFPDNQLIQDYDVALSVANQVLSSFASARRDLSQEWRGDPAMELGDCITTDASRTNTEDYWLIRQKLVWDGTLRASHDGALVPPDYLWLTEDGYIWETEDGYLWETE